MGKLKFTLSNILFWVSIIASCLFLENVAFLSNNLKEGLSNTIFYFLFALIVIGYSAFFTIDHIGNKSKVDYVLLAILTLAFICGAISIFSFSNISFNSSDPNFNFSYEVNLDMQIKEILSLFIFLLTLYATLFFFNKNYPSIRKLNIVYIILMGICYISIIYSLVTEFKLYSDMFNSVENNKEMQSLFWNPNMFAGFLLMGIASAMGLNYFKKIVFSYFSIIVFYVFTVFIGSLTSILTATIGILIYFLIEIIFHIKKKPAQGLLYLSIYLIVSVASFITFAAALRFDLANFSTFCKFIYKKIIDADYQTFSNRKFLWDASIELIKGSPLTLLFGFGFRNSSIILGGYRSAIKLMEYIPISSHSGYMQVILNFGLVGLLIYFSFLVYYIYSFIRLLKKDARFALIYFLIGVIFLVYATMESVIYFNPNTQGIIVGVLFYLPLINKFKHYKHHNLGDDTLKIEKPNILEPNLITKSLSKIFMGILVSVISLFAFKEFRDIEFYRYFLLNLVIYISCYLLFIPFIISSQSIKASRNRFIITAVTNFILINAIFIAMITHYYLHPNLINMDAKWVYVALLLIVLIFEFLFYFIYKKRTFKEYLCTFIGISKLSFMGVIGVLISIILVISLSAYIEFSILLAIIYPVLNLLIYFLFSYFVPIRDNISIMNHYNELSIYSLKRDVMLDRLEAINEN